MTLLVRDEADVIAANIEHHLAAGVNFIIATDNGSTDGTADILAAYRDAGVLELHHEYAQNYEQGSWVTRMARRAASAYRADWVINADADEFFWPLGQTEAKPNCLQESFASISYNYGRFIAPANSLVPDPNINGSWVDRLVVRDTETQFSTNPTVKIVPKCCHRGDPDVDVGFGNHYVSGPRVGPFVQRSPLEMLHAPNRGYEQYRKKIQHKGASFAQNSRLGKNAGGIRRPEYDKLLSGELPAAYREQQLTCQELKSGLTTHLIRDTRLRDRLHRLVSHAIIPRALEHGIKTQWTDPP